MRIAVKTFDNFVFYLNFDLIVDFNFNEGNGIVHFTYSSMTKDDCYNRLRITKEEKNRILNKLDLL